MLSLEVVWRSLTASLPLCRKTTQVNQLDTSIKLSCFRRANQKRNNTEKTPPPTTETDEQEAFTMRCDVVNWTRGRGDL
ncbi:Hypothetical protein PHPALM_11523 [Phytophthora palmivora]|uniref:Uncharacterized protein n=1 Tax=Phytophthora palmivora TaxID=4796 RepID=A0A2P4Y217_9STRA|nr:Hypothetical protein PHPALM_11523 [Phytophthora palmivora]